MHRHVSMVYFCDIRQIVDKYCGFSHARCLIIVVSFGLQGVINNERRRHSCRHDGPGGTDVGIARNSTRGTRRVTQSNSFKGLSEGRSLFARSGQEQEVERRRKDAFGSSSHHQPKLTLAALSRMERVRPLQ